MAKNPVTASERRGILVVAALAIAITGGGVLLPHCRRGEKATDKIEITTINPTDSAGINPREHSENKKKGKKRKKKNQSKKAPGYHERIPLEEPV